MDYTQVLIRPVVTEKTTALKDEANQVVFQVASGANKIEVKRAVEEAFQVRVLSVNVVKSKPRAKKRFGRSMGTIAGYKKAYIQIAPGDKIDYFEGV
jgi:large subunit ribosomal protein L23